MFARHRAIRTSPIRPRHNPPSSADLVAERKSPGGPAISTLSVSLLHTVDQLLTNSEPRNRHLSDLAGLPPNGFRVSSSSAVIARVQFCWRGLEYAGACLAQRQYFQNSIARSRDPWCLHSWALFEFRFDPLFCVLLEFLVSIASRRVCSCCWPNRRRHVGGHPNWCWRFTLDNHIAEFVSYHTSASAHPVERVGRSQNAQFDLALGVQHRRAPSGTKSVCALRKRVI